MVVEQLSRLRAPRAGQWLVTWRIENLGAQMLKLLSGRLPHSLFRCEEIALEGVPTLRPKESARLEFPIKCQEALGTVVENAFLILRVLWAEEPWRILVRLRVSIGPEGVPETTTELITTHRVGFSRQAKGQG